MSDVDPAGRPFGGIRVLDLGSGIATAYCTKLLADQGADVVLVEPPGGDPLRRRSIGRAPGGPAADPAGSDPAGPGDDGPLFRYLHTGKRSAVLDGAEVDALVTAGAADLVVASDLAAAALTGRHPGVVVATVTPFGTSGPWAGRPATDLTLQALAGSIGHRGTADRPPVAAGGRLGEWVGGTFAALGSVAAVLAARASGVGQHVDVSVLEAMMECFQTYQWIYHRFDPDTRLVRSVEIPSIEPAADGWVGFCTITAQQWQDFCAMVEAPELAERHPFAMDRYQHRADVLPRIHAWTSRRTVAEIVELASLLRIPVGPVGDGATVLTMDHLVDRGVFVPHPARAGEAAPPFVQPRRPVRFGAIPDPPFAPAPRLGEHTAAVREPLTAAPPAAPAAAPPPPPAAARPPGTGARPAPARPFAGLRVVDFTAFWAGPSATAAIAALGADVVKIESTRRPDGMRFAGGPGLGRPFFEFSPVFHGANVGKRAVTLDLDQPEGRALAERLVAGADVVVENFSPRVMESFGLGWDRVRALRPDAVMLRMPAFGLDGPWRDRTGFAMTIEQVSGLAWVTGYPDGPPWVPRGVCDVLGGAHAVLALAAALEHRRRTGEGQLVEVPLLEAAVNVAAEQVVEHTAHGVVPGRIGNRDHERVPQGVYPCAGEGDGDGAFVAISCGTDAQWAALAALLGIDEPALATRAARWHRHDELDARIAAFTAAHDRAAVVDRLQAAGVPAEVVVNTSLVGDNPHLRARGFFEERDHPVCGPVEYPSLPFVCSAWPRPLLGAPAPTLGQHNAEVLGGELGLDDAELAALAERGVVGDWPRGLPRPEP